jgi:acyl-CoA synthetase (AMP-forming)/AMP-acid ligase II
MVSGGERGDEPRTLAVGAQVRVGCGVHRPHHAIAIVDPVTRRRVGDGDEGEIWVRGPSVAQGYFGQPEKTSEVFHAQIAGETGGWLRTGDLGSLSEGELYITGRIKDVVVVRGTKLAAEDIEQSFEPDPLLRRSACVAFAHDDGARERLVIVQEVERGATGPFAEIAARIAAAVLERGGAAADVVSLVRPGNIPRTTSGKVRRSACHELFVQGGLDELHRYTRHAS